MWIGLFTGLAEIGGVQQVSRHTAVVLHQLAQEHHQSCELLGLNDPPGSSTLQVGQERYPFRGFGRDKPALAAHLLRLAPRVEFAYLGHPNLAPLGFLLRLRRFRLPYWVAVHGMEVWEPLPFFRRLALRRAQGITSVSAFTAEQMQRAQGMDSRKVFVLPPALEPDFSELPQNGAPGTLPAEARVLMTVGRLLASEPGKGVDGVIRALPAVLRAVPTVIYVVAGDGDMQPRLEQLASAVGVRQNVRFLGAQSLNDLKRWYSRSDVFVMPSRQEGFGVVFLEAMAYGKPVVAANYGGAPEIVREGHTGFLIPYGDEPALADRLIRLLQDESLRRRMGEAGRQRVEQEYTFEQFRRRLSGILESPAGREVECGSLK